MIQVKVFDDGWLLGDPDTLILAEDKLNDFLKNNNVEFVDVKCAALNNSIVSKIVLILVYKEKGE